MSWNLLIFKATSPDSELLRMGPVDEVSKTITAQFPDLEWPTDTECELLVQNGFRIQLKVKFGMVEWLYTDGGYFHLVPISSLCKNNGWFICDCQEGECVDLDDPYGWYDRKYPEWQITSN